MCYYFDDIVTDRDIHSVDFLLDKKIHENISVYDISYKTSTDPKPICIWLDDIDGFSRVLHGEIKHLVLFDYQLFEKILWLWLNIL